MSTELRHIQDLTPTPQMPKFCRDKHLDLEGPGDPHARLHGVQERMALSCRTVHKGAALHGLG